MFGYHRQAIIPGVLAVIGWPAMNDDGQLRRPRQLHLTTEDFFLYLSWRMVVEIVESNLSPCDHPRMPRPPQQFGISGFVCKPCLVRMDSHACPYSRVFRQSVVFLRQLDAAVGRLGPFPI